MAFNLIALDGADAVGEAAAERLLHHRLRQPERPLGLATGRTMEPVYRALVDRTAALPPSELQRLRRQWTSFNLDEYVGLGPGDPRSFATEMAERLVTPLGLNPRQVRLPDGRAPDPDLEASRYATELASAGGIGLQLLGLGLNGHVAFNEPPCGPEARCRCVELSEDTRHRNSAANNDPQGGPGVPERAISLGLLEILAAGSLLLVVTGPAKASILRRSLQEPPSAAVPASWLQTHPDLTLLADQEALAAMDTSPGRPG